ncbi:MAG TPA: hypothetical protein VER33_21910 [Polyangiaceae bacterium]|nr:hypothetical protein [Polyangiaceae bacterium]
MFRVIFLSLAMGVASGCGPATPLTAQAPEVERLTRRGVGGSVALELLDVTDERTCGKTRKFNELCVRGLRSALDTGLSSLLSQFIDPQRAGENYTASFQLLELAQEPVFIGDGDFEQPNLVMRWRFEIRNGAGERLLLLKESSDEALRDVRTAPEALQDVLDDAIKRIAEGLDDAEWKTSRPHSVEHGSIESSVSHPPARSPLP